MAYRKLHGLGAFSTAPVPSNVQAALASASSAYGVPFSLLQAVAFQESSYNPNAVSSAGAQGLLQLMPATGKSLGVTNPFDITQNANAGAKYLSQLYARYGDWNQALIAYNEGPGNLASNGPFSSSQNYANAILGNAGMLGSSASVPVSADTSAPSDFTGTTTTLDFSSMFTGGADATAAPVSSMDLSAVNPLYLVAGGLGLALLVWLVAK